MAFARRFLNSTLLPDGTVLVTGGTSQANARYDGKGWDLSKIVYAAELWNPVTETWSTLAAMQTPRSYHSTAALLPDGRVLVGGGEAPLPTTRSITVSLKFSRPLTCLKAPDPLLPTLPPAVTYGETFFVETPHAMDIARVNWIRLSSVTHAFNQNQRINHLSFTPPRAGTVLHHGTGQRQPGTAGALHAVHSQPRWCPFRSPYDAALHPRTDMPDAAWPSNTPGCGY